MKVAIMQPYFMPYIGYFQMIKAVDKFVFYDDVNFIKKGWINRNRILVGNNDFTFSIPITNASQNVAINNTKINQEGFEIWKSKFIQTLNQNYKKAPQFNMVNKLIGDILRPNYITIGQLASQSVFKTAKYLNIKTKFIMSSAIYNNKELGRKERLIEICKKENATQYINALGGQELYKKEDFLVEDIQLHFLKTLPVKYEQFNSEFIPWLSIIDVLMFNSVEEVNVMLDKYELI